jgi:hypothetical protein
MNETNWKRKIQNTLLLKNTFTKYIITKTYFYKNTIYLFSRSRRQTSKCGKTIMYALSPTKKVTIEYGRPCIYLCNPDSDIFNSNDFKLYKR